MSICVEIVVFFVASVALIATSALFGAQVLRIFGKRKNTKSTDKSGVTE